MSGNLTNKQRSPPGDISTLLPYLCAPLPIRWAAIPHPFLLHLPTPSTTCHTLLWLRHRVHPPHLPRLQPRTHLFFLPTITTHPASSLQQPPKKPRRNPSSQILPDGHSSTDDTKDISHRWSKPDAGLTADRAAIKRLVQRWTSDPSAQGEVDLLDDLQAMGEMFERAYTLCEIERLHSASKCHLLLALGAPGAGDNAGAEYHIKEQERYIRELGEFLKLIRATYCSGTASTNVPSAPTVEDDKIQRITRLDARIRDLQQERDKAIEDLRLYREGSKVTSTATKDGVSDHGAYEEMNQAMGPPAKKRKEGEE